MTEAYLKGNPDTLEIELVVTGHSGYEEKGKDIVCSAVSILVQSIGESIRTLVGDKTLPKNSIVEYGEGTSLILIPCKNKQMYGNVSALFYTTIVGFSMLQDSYPDNFKFVYTCERLKR